MSSEAFFGEDPDIQSIATEELSAMRAASLIELKQLRLIRPDHTDQQDDQHPESIEPHEFMLLHENNLWQSSRNWASAAKVFTTLTDERSRKHVRACLDEIYKINSAHPPEHIRTRETVQHTKNLATFIAMAVRYWSDISEMDDITQRSTDKSLVIFPDQNYQFLYYPNDAVGLDRAKKITSLGEHMALAEQASNIVLYDLCQRAGSDIEQLEVITEYLINGVADIDPRYDELRQIMAADWTHPEPARSYLRDCLTTIRSNPDTLLESFINAVENSTEKDSRLFSVKAMSQLALQVTTIHNIDISTRDVFEKTRQHWASIPLLQEAFEQYVDERVSRLQQALDSVGESLGKKSLRHFVTRDQIIAFKDGLCIDRRPGNQAQSSPKSKRTDTAQLTERSAISMIESSEKPRPRKELFVIRQGTGAPTIVPIDVITLLDKKRIASHSLQEDISRSIELLLDKTFSHGSKPLSGQSSKMKVGGKQTKLFRFAPDKETGFKVHPDNRFYRIVYAVIEDKIVIVDVLNHDEFDKLYAN